jgi:hypothetical protein
MQYLEEEDIQYAVIAHHLSIQYVVTAHHLSVSLFLFFFFKT